MTPSHEAGGEESVAARFELAWACAMGAVIALLLIVIAFTAFHWSSMPPSRVEVIDATRLHLTGEFVQENLGTEVEPGGNVVVHLLAEQYAFRPHCIVLPQGRPVTFRATSADAVHGFQVLGTNINSMLIPGYVSTFIVTPGALGDRAMPCHEFCGVGHAAMWANVRVVSQQEFRSLSARERRVSCD